MIGQVFRFETKLAAPPRFRRIMRGEIVSTLSTGYRYFIHFYYQIIFGFENEMQLQKTMHHPKQQICF